MSKPWVYRKMAAEVIDRPLREGEIVHHKNGRHYDNRPENLEVMTTAEHTKLHIIANKMKRYRFEWKLEQDAADPSDIYWTMLAKLDLSELV